MCSPNVHFDTLSIATDPAAGVGFQDTHSHYSPSGLSRKLPSSSSLKPALYHIISNNGTSVLSLAVDEEQGLVFSGSQSECIFVWELRTLQQRTQLIGHTASVLALELASDKGWLFSSSGDNTVRIWDTRTMQPLFIIYPADDNVGDIFSLKWSAELETLYLGCQNTSIQWICLASVPSSQGATVGSSSIHAVVPTPKPHKFFDSVPPALARHSTFSGRSTPTAGSGSHSRGPPVQFSSATPDVYPLQTWSRSQTPPISDAATSAMLEQAAGQLAKDVVPLQVSSSCVVPSAHYGYIYSLTLLRLDEQRPVVLASGSGDEDVKLWQCTSAGLVPIATLHNSEGGVLTLAARQGTLFAGLQGGCIDIWDLETWTLIRTLVAHDDDVLALCIRNRDLFSTSADGVVKRWDLSFRVAATWIAHEGIVLSCTTSNTHDGHYRLLTGASDNLIKIWDVPPSLPSAVAPRSGLDVSLHTDAMLYSLARFITFRSVSDEAHREDCRQAAHFLKACLTELGAETIVLPGATARNPLVLATFRGRTTLAAGKRRRRCLVYSHYDVIDAGSGPWASDPWTLDGRDGYLYGRGVSDNKGPTLAIACAASQLHASRQLECDVVMLVEGEEEAGSVGFRDALRAHKDQIGPIDVILLSNSYWLGEDTPCLTVGLRGVVQATIEVEGAEPDVHSGVEGGSLQEPMIDMVRLLAGLSDGTNVKVPGFYDAVREVTATERATYESIVHMKQSRADTAEALMARWRHPSLSVHRIDVSGPRNATIIPSRASAAVSIRIVPDQDLAIIEKALVTSVEENFKMLNSPNTVKVHVDHRADWWLGSPSSLYSVALASAVEVEWGVRPVNIREGGSIPAVALLEKELNAPAVHLPMGQASDRAHLADERIRLVNLQKGKAVVLRFFAALPSLGTGGMGTETSAETADTAAAAKAQAQTSADEL